MNYFNKKGAATPAKLDRIQCKKSVNTKVNKTVNFLMGISLVLLSAYFIMEINTQVKTKKVPSYKKVTLELEINKGVYKIIKNNPQVVAKAKVQKKPIPQKKFDLAKPPVIDDKKAEEFEDPIDQLVPDNSMDNDPVVDLPSEPVSSGVPSPKSSPVNMVSEVPLFPGCSPAMDRNERIDCLNKKMGRFVQRKFDTTKGNNLNRAAQVKISVVFTIGVNGEIKDIIIKAPTQELEDEARKVISKLPAMTPGKMNGEAVNVTYSLPITYQVND